MPYTDEGKAVMLYGIANTISHVSLHSGPPNKGNELTGGVYRRKQIDFSDPETGEVRNEREITFDVPQGARITHAGFWSASYGGTLLAAAPTTEREFRGRGVYVIDLVKLGITNKDGRP